MGEMVADYVDENLSDAVIFGQEVTKEFLEGYKEKLGNHWRFYGSFRCNDKLARITKNWGNEAVGVLTKTEASKQETIPLTSTKQIKRLCQRVDMEILGLPTATFTTHMEHKNHAVQQAEQEEVIEAIQSARYAGLPVILSAQQNVYSNSQEFQEMQAKMGALGMKPTIVNGRTYQGNVADNPMDSPVSYIWYSDEFSLVDEGIIKEQPTEKHYPIYASLTLSEKGLEQLHQESQEKRSKHV